MKDALSFLVQSLLQKNKIKIDSNELNFQIQSHPSYPSLHAVTGVLNHFDIENTAIKVPVNETVLAQLPKSFIAQIKTDEGTDLVLIINKGLQYKIVSNNNKTISLETFLEQFTGILVAVEKDETVTLNNSNSKNTQKGLFGIAIILFVLLFFTTKPSLFTTLYFVLALFGAAISYLIIQHDLGLNSKIVDSICSQESKTTNCNAVLNSKAATLYKNIKLSDVSLIYFTSISITALVLSLINASLNTLHIISLAGLPIVAYSIYYQIKVTKNWCLLCLAIASVLLLQASLLLFKNINFIDFKTIYFLIIGLVFTSIATLWLFTNSKLKEEQKFKSLKIETTKFKRNFDLFNTLLQKPKTVNTSIPETTEIILGNKNTTLNIVVITNPFCGHCKGVHNLVESIIRQHHEQLSITIRFNINTSNPKSNGVLVSTRLLELFHNEGQTKCLKAMYDIYNNSDVLSWLDTWKTCSDKNYVNNIETEYNWCLNNNINFTPEILINGKSFPNAYDRDDLKFFIEDLIEYYTSSSSTKKLQETA